MTRKLSKNDVANSSSAYWTHADIALSSEMIRLPYTKEQLAGFLNFHSLFSEYLCVPDIMLLNNDLLRDLIMRDYHPLISNAIIVPMLRSSVKNFEELEYQFRLDKTVYGMLEKTKAQTYANFLDDELSTILPTKHEYFKEALTQNFHNTLLDSDFLRESGLSRIEKKLQKYIKDYSKRWDTGYLRRSTFFFFADKLKQDRHPRYAEKVKLLSTAVYNKTFIDPLNLAPALPNTSFEALSNISRKDKYTFQFAPYIKKNQFDGVIQRIEEMSLSIDELRWLKPCDIVEIRKTKEAKSYFDKAKKAAQETESFKASNDLIEALSSYLGNLNLELAYIRTGKRKKRSRMQNKMRIVKWGGAIGGTCIGLVSGWGAAAFGLVWIFAGSKLEKRISNNLDISTLSAYEKLKKISLYDQHPILNVSETIEGKKPPLF